MQNDERRQVFIGTAKSVRNPRAHAGATRQLTARLDVGDGRIVIDRLCIHRLDDTDIVHDRSDVGQQFANPCAVLTVL